MNPQLALLLQFLVQLRAERLQQEHAYARQVSTESHLHVVACAAEVDIVERIAVAVKDLDSDEGEFVHRYLEKK